MIKRISIKGHPHYNNLEIDFSGGENSQNVFEAGNSDQLERVMIMSEGDSTNSLARRQALNEMLLLIKNLAIDKDSNHLLTLTKSGSSSVVNLFIVVDYYYENKLHRYYAIVSNGSFVHQSLSAYKNGKYSEIIKSDTEKSVFSEVKEMFLTINNFFYDRNLHLLKLSVPDILKATNEDHELVSKSCKTIARLIHTDYIREILNQLIGIMDIADPFSTNYSSVITEIVISEDKESNFPLDVISYNNRKQSIKNYISDSDPNSSLLILTLMLFISLITKDCVFVIHNLDQIIDTSSDKYFKNIKKAIEYCIDVKNDGLSSSDRMQFIITLSDHNNLHKLI